MARYKTTFTRQELKAKLGYKLTDAQLSQLQYGIIVRKKFYAPIILENLDWYESKLGNVFYYCSAFKKLEKHLLKKNTNKK